MGACLPSGPAWTHFEAQVLLNNLKKGSDFQPQGLLNLLCFRRSVMSLF